MAVRAFASISGHQPAQGDSDLLNFELSVTVLGEDGGTLENFPNYTLEVDNVSTGLLSNILADLAAAVEGDLIAHDVPYSQLLDSVVVS